MPTVDIAIPCYNYARFLRDAVESVLKQSFKDLRILIVDNGSDDGSHEVARRLAAEDDRVDVRVFVRNIGPHGCYNAGVDWASGDYFFLLDADDLLTPGSLERGVAVMEQNPDIAFSYSTELFWGLNGEDEACPDIAPGETAWRLTPGAEFIRQRCHDTRNIVGAPTVLRRTSVQKAIGHYRASLPFTDDLEMWLRLATLGAVAESSTPQGIRRVHASQASESYRAVPARDFVERVAAFESFFANEGAAMADARELLRVVKKAIGQEVFWYGLGRHREGDRANAVRCVKYGLELCPVANAPRLMKWFLSGEVSLHQAGLYLSALLPGMSERSARLMTATPARRNADSHPAER